MMVTGTDSGRKLRVNRVVSRFRFVSDEDDYASRPPRFLPSSPDVAFLIHLK